MALPLVYLYAHVKVIKEPSFANALKYENRQFHRNAVAGHRVGTLLTIAHERRVRDELRSGVGHCHDLASTPMNNEQMDVQ